MDYHPERHLVQFHLSHHRYPRLAAAPQVVEVVRRAVVVVAVPELAFALAVELRGAQQAVLRVVLSVAQQEPHHRMVFSQTSTSDWLRQGEHSLAVRSVAHSVVNLGVQQPAVEQVRLVQADLPGQRE